MKKIFVNGTFDILHRAHLEMLNYAKSLGDYLLVAIDGDRRVKELKGRARPVHSESDRKFFLENLRAVDSVAIFHSDEQLVHLLQEYKPAVMVKGSDYYNQPIIGSQYCDEIAFFERQIEYSTTNTIEKIKTPL